MPDKFISEIGGVLRTTLYAEADTNPLTDALLTKINGIEAGATADLTGAEIVSLIDNELGNSDWQTKVTGAEIVSLLDTELGSADWQSDTTYTVGDGGLTEINFTAAKDSKLAGIEAGATDDLTGTEIVSLLDAELGSSDWQTDTDTTYTNISEFANDAAYITSDPSGVAGADVVTNIISLTQAEYDAIGTPDASTLYYITN